MILGFQSGVSGRVLRRILNGNLQTGRKGQYVDYVSFDTADKIVCATVGPWAWRNNDDLAPFYGPLKVMSGELARGYELPEGFEITCVSETSRYRWLRASRRREVAV